MPTPIDIAGDVVAGGTALAGLVLVYIGGVAANYSTFDTDAKPAIRFRYRVKVWFAVAGVVLSIAAAALGLVAKWQGSNCAANVAIIALLLGMAWGVAIAALSAMEID